MESIYYGESPCRANYKNGAACRNRAYYFDATTNMVLCGIHANKQICNRLPQRSNNDKQALKHAQHTNEVAAAEQARLVNIEKQQLGQLILYRMEMRKAVTCSSGFVRVFPNYRHQQREDGLGCAALSPMSLGPVQHGQPGLPAALNLENFHQGSKCFPQEAIATATDVRPGELFYHNRLQFYQDPEPHRHKYKGVAPLYFVWVDTSGKEHYLSYIESRQFYCHFYERLARQTKEYQFLLQLHQDGYNLQICGYDGHPIAATATIEQAYLDPSVPFGHERVLLAMLSCSAGQEANLPWRKHATFMRTAP